MQIEADDVGDLVREPRIVLCLKVRLRCGCSRFSFQMRRCQRMVEYAFIAVRIAVVLIVVSRVAGQQVNDVFSNVSNPLGRWAMAPRVLAA